MAMHHLAGLTRLVAGICLAILLGTPLRAAADSPRRHLDSLRAEHRYDAAIEYLEQLQETPEAQQDLKDVVLVELGLTLVEASRRERDPIRRRQRLDKAAASFLAFIEQHPDHPRIISARQDLGNVLVEMARFAVEQAKLFGLDKPGSEPILNEARGHYGEATAVLQKNLAALRTKLDDLPKVLDPQDPEQRKLIASRQEYRADFLQVSLILPAIAEEHAETFPAEAKEREDFLQNAAEAYGDVYSRYRTRLAGLYARMYQGRCFVKLGQHRRALGMFDDLLGQPDSPGAFQILKLKVAVLAAECWLDDSQKNYQRAIAQLSEVLDTLKAEQAKTPDALRLRLALAQAHQRFAAQIAGDSPDDPRVTESRQKAVKEARFVALHSDLLRDDANNLLSQLGAKDPLEGALIGEIKSFAELSTLGRRSMDQWQRASADARRIAARLASETDARLKDVLNDQLELLNETAQAAQDKALAAYQRALELAADEPLEKVNQVRYFTCYVLYTAEKFQDAAEMGEQLARKSPDSGTASQCAKIAFASYLQLYNKSESDEERARARDHLQDFGAYILEHWDDQPVGEDVRRSLEGLK